MIETIKARYSRGRIEPLDPIKLEEGSEVFITITQTVPPATGEDPTTATAGAWKGLLNCQTFEREVYESRLRRTRSEMHL